ncbi:MAG: nucleoside monophosphate kinase [archaeon]|nr:nucleoside monophosphate kinase [archaeon]
MAKILFVGPTCSGKGTQAKLLKKYGYTHLSSGDLIRESKDPEIVSYRESNDYKNGILLSDKLLFEILEKNLKKTSKKYILDGFIRNTDQAKYAKKKDLINLVFYFELDKETAVKRGLNRLKLEKRTDDTIKGLEGKFIVYEKKTLPMIAYLKKNFELYTLDAKKSIEEIHQEVKEILGLK